MPPKKSPVIITKTVKNPRKKTVAKNARVNTRKRESSQVKFLTTGGTIDKIYNMHDGSLGFEKSHLPEILKEIRFTIPYTLETLFCADSLHLTLEDRMLMVKKIESCGEDRVIITHGTDTMVETAYVLAKELKKSKTVVLVGAMVPYSFGRSDALFNIGGAVIAVQTLPHGVYLCMNGKIFHPENVRKNRTKGIFESLSAKIKTE